MFNLEGLSNTAVSQLFSSFDKGFDKIRKIVGNFAHDIQDKSSRITNKVMRQFASNALKPSPSKIRNKVRKRKNKHFENTGILAKNFARETQDKSS